MITVPLILLAIASLLGGYWLDPIVFGDYFDGSIFVSPEHNVIGHLAAEYHGIWGFIVHGVTHGLAFWLALAGLITAWYVYTQQPQIAEQAKQKLSLVYRVLEDKYGFDRFNEIFFAGGARATGQTLWKLGDVLLIDGLLVNGSARVVGWVAGVVRHLQSGYLYHYAFSMILGLLALLSWYLWQAPLG